MKVYTQGAWCTQNVDCTFCRIKYGHPQEGKTQDKKRKEKSAPSKITSTERGILMTHDVEAAYSCLVFSCWRQERFWVFKKHGLHHKQPNSLAASWKKIQHLCPWKIQVCPYLSARLKCSLSQQKRSLDQPLPILSITCKRMTKPKTVMNSPTWPDIKLV